MTKEVAKEKVGTNPQWWHTLNKKLFSRWSTQAHLTLSEEEGYTFLLWFNSEVNEFGDL